MRTDVPPGRTGDGTVVLTDVNSTGGRWTCPGGGRRVEGGSVAGNVADKKNGGWRVCRRDVGRQRQARRSGGCVNANEGGVGDDEDDDDEDGERMAVKGGEAEGMGEVI